MYVCYWGKCLLNGAKEVYYYYPKFNFKIYDIKFRLFKFLNITKLSSLLFCFPARPFTQLCQCISHTNNNCSISCTSPLSPIQWRLANRFLPLSYSVITENIIAPQSRSKVNSMSSNYVLDSSVYQYNNHILLARKRGCYVSAVHTVQA